MNYLQSVKVEKTVVSAIKNWRKYGKGTAHCNSPAAINIEKSKIFVSFGVTDVTARKKMKIKFPRDVNVVTVMLID